jgi:hypothetical protein
MMKLGKNVGAALVMGVVLAALAGCDKPAGPAERAGKEVDKTVDKAGQQIEKAGENIQDAAKGDKKP